MLIRPTEEDDWQTLKTIRLAALRDAPTAFGVSYQSAAADSDARWKQRAASSSLPEFWLAFDGAEPVGLAGGGVDQAGRYHLIAMWVAPAARGSDAARRLVDAVKARAVARGHARVVLDVAPENGRAAGFYRREGFVFLDEREPLASHPHISVQRMAWLAVQPAAQASR
ncbi:N-acetyltransferase [uncultured Massilia sp.]|uniref:GNAT family N-acetyltransferase n=1 Tax=uncultured Massilia sp. TaxID=169973 RepID=UPI0025DF9F4B|nr:GNAT family N-acetyltransferase [uncultured Massilia sp.]